jgi:hypothetical protein
MRRRELADATEFMHRGDTVTVASGDWSFTATVTHAAGDLMTLETSDALVDFNLDAGPIFAVVERARAGLNSVPFHSVHGLWSRSECYRRRVR